MVELGVHFNDRDNRVRVSVIAVCSRAWPATIRDQALYIQASRPHFPLAI
jgi:hypothetical protein